MSDAPRKYVRKLFYDRVFFLGLILLLIILIFKLSWDLYENSQNDINIFQENSSLESYDRVIIRPRAQSESEGLFQYLKASRGILDGGDNYMDGEFFNVEINTSMGDKVVAKRMIVKNNQRIFELEEDPVFIFYPRQ